ncbi:hypothetical protein QBC43DRAFT_353439 [Cladorrhinum sp. PSN259]|nr:hypothetical protein QBC43DRAFT_353439 [Cladorrhinum sp. PSN259]
MSNPTSMIMSPEETRRKGKEPIRPTSWNPAEPLPSSPDIYTGTENLTVTSMIPETIFSQNHTSFDPILLWSDWNPEAPGSYVQGCSTIENEIDPPPSELEVGLLGDEASQTLTRHGASPQASSTGKRKRCCSTAGSNASKLFSVPPHRAKPLLHMATARDDRNGLKTEVQDARDVLSKQTVNTSHTELTTCHGHIWKWPDVVECEAETEILADQIQRNLTLNLSGIEYQHHLTLTRLVHHHCSRPLGQVLATTTTTITTTTSDLVNTVTSTPNVNLFGACPILNTNYLINNNNINNINNNTILNPINMFNETLVMPSGGIPIPVPIHESHHEIYSNDICLPLYESLLDILDELSQEQMEDILGEVDMFIEALERQVHRLGKEVIGMVEVLEDRLRLPVAAAPAPAGGGASAMMMTMRRSILHDRENHEGEMMWLTGERLEGITEEEEEGVESDDFEETAWDTIEGVEEEDDEKQWVKMEDGSWVKVMKEEEEEEEDQE